MYLVASISYSLGPLTPDQIDFLHAVPVKVLVAAANGTVDLNQLARQELANRGYDRDGVWVGFAAARIAYHGSNSEQPEPGRKALGGTKAEEPNPRVLGYRLYGR